ncbi:hypothetical protein N0824_02569 [Microcystis sp. 0824]|nr:hypothetical protein N0824_02569 [Microcystis sp. 0824]
MNQTLPAPLKIDLIEEEDKNLLELQKLAGIPYRVKERAEIIRLRHYGWSVEKIAEYKGKSPHIVIAVSKSPKLVRIYQGSFVLKTP